MSRARAERPRDGRPRRMGLLTAVEHEPSRPNAGAGVGVGERDDGYEVGERIAGDLTVIGRLPTGRIGRLYQVWSAGEWCAFTCKILSPRYHDDRRARAALRREARILRRAHHPNIVRGFHEGEHDGSPFLLMEYLESPSLFDLLERRPDRRLGIADAVRTILHAAAGLRHLHRLGWLHLDLKPANLLLRGSVPVLIDFDTARRIQPDRRPSSRLGTDPYMAPEQVRCEPPTPASDVYGLGALLYELVTGRWPFEAVYTGEEPRTGDEKRYPQLRGEPPSPREFNSELPRSLERTILRCLAPDPDERFASMHPLLLALADELDDPVAFWPEGVRTERRREPRE